MTMGRGTLINISRKHKLNVGSSTESELVSIADVLGIMMWSKYFMEAQGYTYIKTINPPTYYPKMVRCPQEKQVDTSRINFSLSLIKLHKKNSLYNTGVLN